MDRPGGGLPGDGMARTRRLFPNDPKKNTDEVRYFITSLHFDREYIGETMARIIRGTG